MWLTTYTFGLLLGMGLGLKENEIIGTRVTPTIFGSFLFCGPFFFLNVFGSHGLGLCHEPNSSAPRTFRPGFCLDRARVLGSDPNLFALKKKNSKY